MYSTYKYDSMQGQINRFQYTLLYMIMYKPSRSGQISVKILLIDILSFQALPVFVVNFPFSFETPTGNEGFQVDLCFHSRVFNLNYSSID